MADKTNKNDLFAKYATFKAGSGIAYDVTAKKGSAHVGKAVMQTADDEVDLVTTGLEIFGKLIQVHPDDFCTVQVKGYARLPATGTITYTAALNGLNGSATAGSVKASAAPAAGGVKAIQSEDAGYVIADLG